MSIGKLVERASYCSLCREHVSPQGVEAAPGHHRVGFQVAPNAPGMEWPSRHPLSWPRPWLRGLVPSRLHNTGGKAAVAALSRSQDEVLRSPFSLEYVGQDVDQG